MQALCRCDAYLGGLMMFGFLKQFFTWWNGSTMGTGFFTWLHGEKVGEDQFGNIYYEGAKNRYGRKRRWVIYKDSSDPSLIPPGWHGWMHYRTQIPPSKVNYVPHSWEKPHKKNLTGTTEAYMPKKSNRDSKNKLQNKNYEAWSPES